MVLLHHPQRSWPAAAASHPPSHPFSAAHCKARLSLNASSSHLFSLPPAATTSLGDFITDFIISSSHGKQFQIVHSLTPSDL
ncbi:hypothetical protein LDENG_00178480 [Lucifuga dentata]|nr:hypothetical protein LDENG_00178480 [Lucifuga dentata]